MTVTGLAADLDLFLLESSRCAALDCLAASTGSQASDEEVAFHSDGSPRTLVLDGFREASSAFVIDVTCPDEPPDTDTSDDTDAPDDTDTSDDTDPADDTGGAPGDPACGCQGVPGRGSWSGLLLLALALGARPARRR